MKKLILILITSFAFAQDGYVAVLGGLDLKNATLGSVPTQHKPELDIISKFIMAGKNIEVSVVYERFESISFQKYGFGIGYQFPLYSKFGKTMFIPSIEPCLIDRWGDEWQASSSHLSIGVNTSFRWFFTDEIGVELLVNFLPRVDLKARYPEINSSVPIVTSTYLCLIYKLN